jgi:hypothetical protein
VFFGKKGTGEANGAAARDFVTELEKVEFPYGSVLSILFLKVQIGKSRKCMIFGKVRIVPKVRAKS